MRPRREATKATQQHTVWEKFEKQTKVIRCPGRGITPGSSAGCSGSLPIVMVEIVLNSELLNSLSFQIYLMLLRIFLTLITYIKCNHIFQIENLPTN